MTANGLNKLCLHIVTALILSSVTMFSSASTSGEQETESVSSSKLADPNDEEEEVFDDDSLPEPGSSLAWMVEKRKVWSQDVEYIGNYFDALAGDTDTLNIDNKSYLTVRLESSYSKEENFELKPRLKLHLDLPATKEKYRILIETNPDQSNDISERIVSDLPSVDSAKSDGLYGSVRALFETEKWDRLSFDVGVKAKWPPDPFARARAVRNWELKETLNLLYDQELFFFETKGLGIYSGVQLDKRLDTTFMARSNSVVDWYERRELFEYLQQFSLFHDVDNRQMFQYAAGVTGETHRGGRLTNAYVMVTYRYRIYQDWLYTEVVPGIEFNREYDFSGNPFIGVKLEMLFAGTDGIRLRRKLY